MTSAGRLLAATLLLFTPIICAAESPEIGGVKLGISSDVALKTIGLGYVKFTTKSSDGRYTITFLHKEPENGPRESWTIQESGGKVVFVDHFVGYQNTHIPINQYPDPRTTDQRLQAKYGPEMYSHAPNLTIQVGRPFWAWDQNESQYTTQNMKTAQSCSEAIESLTVVTAGPRAFNVPSGASLRPNCSYLVMDLAHVGTNPDGKNVIVDLDVYMMDVRPYYALALQDSKKPKAAPPQQMNAPL